MADGHDGVAEDRAGGAEKPRTFRIFSCVSGRQQGVRQLEWKGLHGGAAGAALGVRGRYG